jgi:hypothetical protein
VAAACPGRAIAAIAAARAARVTFRALRLATASSQADPGPTGTALCD